MAFQQPARIIACPPCCPPPFPNTLYLLPNTPTSISPQPQPPPSPTPTPASPPPLPSRRHPHPQPNANPHFLPQNITPPSPPLTATGALGRWFSVCLLLRRALYYAEALLVCSRVTEAGVAKYAETYAGGLALDLAVVNGSLDSADVLRQIAGKIKCVGVGCRWSW